MKKVLSLVGAGALLLSMATVAFASVKQFGFATSSTGAVSSSGAVYQSGKGSQTAVTGDSGAAAVSLTAANVNVGGHHVTQFGGAISSTGATSSSGAVTQTGSSSHHGGSQYAVTGNSGAFAGSATVSNVSVSF